MLDRLTREDFLPHLETTFRLKRPGEPALDLRLVEATAVGGGAAYGERQPFSLLFLGPGEPILPQSIYPLHHDQLGELGLFLVPVGPAEDGMRYESIFN